MPWVQRATTSLHRFSAIWSPRSGRRQITGFAVSQRPSSISVYPQTNRAFAALSSQLLYKLAIGRNALGRQDLARRTPTCSDLPDAQTMAFNSIRQPDIHADSTANATDTPYSVVNFYHLVDIANPYQVIADHKLWVQGKDLAGRIYLSTQGINAQYSGLTADAEGYAMWLQQQDLFKGMRWSSFPVDSHQFPKLRLKFKQNLISLAGGMTRLPVTDPKARAIPLAPYQWKQMLAGAQYTEPRHLEPADAASDPPGASNKRPETSNARLDALQGRPDGDAQSSGELHEPQTSAAAARADVVVLDVRNDYEWDAGHFQGADRPQEEKFNETPTEASNSDSIPSYLQGKAADTPVMMYCTGGIRCDVYSAHLRDKGFTNLYTLEGGIQNYLREEGHQLWDGSLFVFDGRMAVPSGDPEHEGQLVAAAPCTACGETASLPHMNCANIDCNKLFLACDQHKEEFAGCCSQACLEAPRLLRPPKQAGYYGNWTTYSSDDDVSKANMIEGRGSGRLARRRKRIGKMRAKEAIAREERHARKELVKAAMQSRQNQSDHQDENHDAQQLDAAKQSMARMSILQHQQHAQTQLQSV
ncbi:TPA: hypothetical protein ACH3X2_009457 [Trebouxia sp. C0005]